MVKLFEGLRFIGVAAAFYFGYSLGYEDAYNPEAQLHFMIPVIISSIAGLSGIEGLFFSEQAALSKGFELKSNYQVQSAIALLSYASVSIMVFFFNWGIRSELTILSAFMFFLIFSAVNHTVSAIGQGNYKWMNLNRPFLTAALIAGFFHPVMTVLKKM